MRTLKRSVILLVALLAGAITALAMGATANAAPSPYGHHATCSASSSTVAAGGSITLSCAAFRPGGTAQETLIGKGPPVSVGSSTVGADGSFSATVTIPSDTRSGTHHIKVMEPPVGGPGGGAKVANVRIDVTAAGAAAAVGHGRLSAAHLRAKTAAASTPLAYQGVAVIGLGALGAILLAGGGVMLLRGRRGKASA